MKTIVFLLVLMAALPPIGVKVAAQTIHTESEIYFPPVGKTEWKKVSPESLGWNTAALKDLKDFLNLKNTKSFMILVNGRIAVEEYFDGHRPDSDWQWNSAGKTLTSFAVGIARQQGLLSIDDPVSKYLGEGWSAEPAEKEKKIRIRNLLSMTSGLNDAKQRIIPRNLTYLADAGSRWAYSNVFQLLMKIVSVAGNQKFDDFVQSNICSPIGMDGYWKSGPIFTIFHSTTRSMARFGLLALNRGNWNGNRVLDSSFFGQSIRSSQNLNPSYGFLWWLNGQTNYMLPRSRKVFKGPLVPNAPADMYAALGAADQKLYVIPSQNMVIVRMGNSADPKNRSFAASGFDNQLWQMINRVIGSQDTF